VDMQAIVTRLFQAPTPAYDGPAELTGGAAWTAWTLDPVMLGLCVLVGAVYVAGVLNSRRQGVTWPLPRSLSFVVGGLGSVALVSCSFVEVYADSLFWVRVVQLSMLFLFAPLFLALGRPVSLLAAVLSGERAARARRVLHSPPARLLGSPVTGLTLIMGLPWVLLFSAWAPATLRHGWADHLTQVVLVVLGFLYYWTRLQCDPVPRRYPPGVSLFIGFMEVIFSAGLGLVLIYGVDTVARGYYDDLNRPWGPDAHLDQQMGGGMFWLVGHVAGIIYIVILYRLAHQADLAASRAVDAQLDAKYAEVGEAELTTPWWETDPRFAHLRRER
jgi:cytochrome c oxidase assembly factor CtaG